MNSLQHIYIYTYMPTKFETGFGARTVRCDVCMGSSSAIPQHLQAVAANIVLRHEAFRMGVACGLVYHFEKVAPVLSLLWPCHVSFAFQAQHTSTDVEPPLVSDSLRCAVLVLGGHNKNKKNETRVALLCLPEPQADLAEVGPAGFD